MDPNEFSQMNSEDETLPRLMFFFEAFQVYISGYMCNFDGKVTGRWQED